MRIYCGTDIIEIERIKNSIDNIGDRFIQKVYTPREIEYCESKKNQRYQHYAARFAAKEAIFKAISTQLSNKYEITWKNIEIVNDEQGKPYVNIHGINNPIFENIDISISHCKSYAVAYAVMLQKEDNV